MAERILVVEDETTLGANIARFLARAGHAVTTVETGAAALEELRGQSFDIVVSDLRLPDMDGLSILDQVRANQPETVVLIMTAYASVDSAVEALRRGAHDYILKPLSLADLQRKVDYIAEHRRLGRENAQLRTLLRGESDAIALLRAGGKAMNDLCDWIERVAASNSNVLIVGESGTGKEVAARAVHECSARAEGPFVTLNVSAMPENLVESYLFGHEKGAFTGAERRRDGLFRAATGGTLFLDEIGELPLPVQAKLLRVVESREILPVGADKPLKVDARIVAATHRDLGKMVEEGRFRHDLRYRLNVVQLAILPLRERKADVAALARHFADKHAKAQRKNVRGIAPDAMAMLTAYAWPGNVRELSNVIERAVILSSDDAITPMDLPAELGTSAAAVDPQSEGSIAANATAVSTAAPGPDDNLERAVLDFQKAHIARVLDRTQGNRDAAARLLGLSPATLYRYLQRVGLKGYRTEEGR